MSAREEEPRERIPSWLVLAAIVALGGALRFLGLGAESLWLDEGFSASWAKLSPSAILAACAADFQGPLYYLLLHGWVRVFGDSDAALRGLSALASTLTLPVLHALTLRLFSRGAARLATLLLAVSSFHVYFAQEARCYALLALLAVLSFTLYTDVLRGSGRAASITHVLTTALLGLVHAHAAFVGLAQAIHALVVLRSDRVAGRRALLHLAAAAGLCLPWAAVVAAQAARFQGAFWAPRPELRHLVGTLRAWGGSWPAFAVLGCAALAALVALRRLDRDRRVPAGRTLLLAWLAVPVLVPFALSHLVQPLYLTRAAIAASLPFVVLAGAGLSLLARRPPILWTTLVLTLLLAAGDLWRQATTIEKEPWREVAALVDATALPGELVLFDSGLGRDHVYMRYTRRTDLDLRAFPPERRAPTQADLMQLEALASGRPRVWLVRSHSHDALGLLRAALLRTHRLTLARGGRGVEVALFELPRPGAPPGGAVTPAPRPR